MDITERKWAEETIRLNEARLESLFKISQYKATDVRDLLKFVLEEAIRLTGSKLGYIYHYNEQRREFTLNNWSSNVMKECTIAEPQAIYQLDKTGIWGEAVRQGRPIIINNSHAPDPLKKGYPDGHALLSKYMTIPVIIDDAIVGVIGLANKSDDYDEADVRQLTLLMDSAWKIVDRRQMEKALRTISDRYRSFIELTGELGWTTNADGEVVEDMPSWRIYTSQTYEEIKGWGWSKALHPDDLEHTLQIWKTSVMEKSAYETEYRIRRYDGIYRHFMVRGIPVLNKDGNIREWVGTCIDITERKAAEEAIKTVNQKLQAAYKEMESFSYSISHDLRAPLRHMSGFAELLIQRQEGQLDEKSHHYASMIVSASKKMGMLIDDLLAFSKMGRMEMKQRNVNLNDIVREAIQDIHDETKGRDIVWRIDELPDVYGDQSLLKLVFDNLISNAVKYTRTRPQAEIRIGCKDEGSEIICSVKDNGVGFDMKYADRLFEVFQRLHAEEEFEGTGIGLANVQRIISRHGGRTWADGAVGQGAIFYFTLPKTKEI
jgi:PAS domain S-box-containing protein